MKFFVTGGTGFIGQRVVKSLIARQIPVVVADRGLDQQVINRLRGTQSAAGDNSAPAPNVEFLTVDVSDFRDVMSVFHQHPDITHVIHLAYLMSAECEGNPHLAVRVNVLGMVNLFEAAVMRKLTRLIFTSSETYYGTSQENYGNRAVVENDFCSPSDHFFIYGMMKILNEFMAEKYVKKHGVSMACTRPPVVFGFGRKRGSVLWAEDFATKPARGESALLPFPAETRNSFIYVGDCAEQLVRLSLKPQISHFAYNCGGETASAAELASKVRHWLPEARIEFDASKARTPFIEQMDGTRLELEINFKPRPLIDGIRAHINEARQAAGLGQV